MKLVAFKTRSFLLLFKMSGFSICLYWSNAISSFSGFFLVALLWLERLVVFSSSIRGRPAMLCKDWLNFWNIKLITVGTARILQKMTRYPRFFRGDMCGDSSTFSFSFNQFPKSSSSAGPACLWIRWRPLLSFWSTVLPRPQRWRCKIVESRILVNGSTNLQTDLTVLSILKAKTALEWTASNSCLAIVWRRTRGRDVTFAFCTLCPKKSNLFTCVHLNSFYAQVYWDRRELTRHDERRKHSEYL